MELKIYKNKELEKVYTADTYDLTFGVVEDVAKAIDLDSLKTGSDVEIIQMAANLVLGSMDTVKEILKDIFDGLSDEEIRRATVLDIAGVLVDVVKYTIIQLNKTVREKNGIMLRAI